LNVFDAHSNRAKIKSALLTTMNRPIHIYDKQRMKSCCDFTWYLCMYDLSCFTTL